MSAYHQVKDGTAYPAVLLTTGMNDPRVDPWQAGKMAARLQAASSSGKPVLMRVEWQGGHGQGSTRTQREEELADIYAFLLWQFGDDGFVPDGGERRDGRVRLRARPAPAPAPAPAPHPRRDVMAFHPRTERTMELVLWRHADAEEGVLDMKRQLTDKGRKQAARVARWLRPRLEGEWVILASPAARARQTADALDLDYDVRETLGTGATEDALLREAGWPDGARQRHHRRPPAHPRARRPRGSSRGTWATSPSRRGPSGGSAAGSTSAPA